jgi:hypothetical protein
MFHASPAEQIRESEGRVPLPVAGKQNQTGENGLRFLEADVHLPAESAVPAQRGPATFARSHRGNAITSFSIRGGVNGRRTQALRAGDRFGRANIRRR